MATHLESNRVVSDDARSNPIVAKPRREKSKKAPKWKPFGRAPQTWWPDILLGIGFIINTIVLMWPSPAVQFDSWVRVTAYHLKVEWLSHIAYVLTFLGAGRAVAPVVVALVVWCAMRHRSIRPLLMFTAGFAGLGIIFILKNVFGRPHSLHPFKLFVNADYGAILFDYLGKSTAYPSGHATNTIVFYGMALMLIGGSLSRKVRWTIMIAPPILVVTSQIYAGYHWLFDAPAGFMLGILIVRGVRRVHWDKIPLGPLQRFEPASPRLIIESSLLIVSLGLCATLPRLQGAVLGSLIVVISLVWAVIRYRRRNKVD